MIKFLFLLLYVLLMVGCAMKPIYPYKSEDDPAFWYRIIRIDGCEYIRASYVFGHKGNCDNPMHQYNIQGDQR